MGIFHFLILLGVLNNFFATGMSRTTSLWDAGSYQIASAQNEAMKAFIARGKTETWRKGSNNSTDADSLNEEGSSNTSSTKFSPHNKGFLDWNNLQQAIDVIKTTFRLYGTRGVAAAFNGGKDATIVLDLYTAALANHYQANPDVPKLRPRAVYFLEQGSEFRDVEEFVEAKRKELDLDLEVCRGSIVESIGPYMKTLGVAKAELDEDWVRHPAFLLGVRRGDPRSETLSVFEPSSDWFKANFMRVHPILDWNYGMVWEYFELFRTSYCPLYDQGYTSLGKVSETVPNAYLKELGSLKARDLVEWASERGGRKPPGNQSPTPQGPGS
eukprot:Gregarina_sp_Pseudo_9__4278@NODE_442_length_2821_cov_67_168943_g418_i0_p2_GENE_NODE_442_length_2821_cov_67_168943_g418_i0NODE_442_length_2821_cov_67_168943_g418_i0_p2_ORF_typecomplete_len327_score26_16PAPS_reduct/PF01507_19/1_3e28_NODE_442_length_2821_cov_67_168943_g418_i013142294